MALFGHSQVNHGGGSGAARSGLVLGANTFSLTEVGALSVVAHPDNGQCLFPFLRTSIAAGEPASTVAVNHPNRNSLNHLSSWALAARSKPFYTLLSLQPKKVVSPSISRLALSPEEHAPALSAQRRQQNKLYRI